MSEIHEVMKDISNNKSNTAFFDIRTFLDFREEYFLDKMHLNPSGCRIFAELMGNYIASKYIDK